MIDFSTPLAGMNQASNRLMQSAGRIAQASSQARDSIDLSAEMVAVLQARNAFTANTKVVKVGDEMMRATLDLLA